MKGNVDIFKLGKMIEARRGSDALDAVLRNPMSNEASD